MPSLKLSENRSPSLGLCSTVGVWRGEEVAVDDLVVVGVLDDAGGGCLLLPVGGIPCGLRRAGFPGFEKTRGRDRGAIEPRSRLLFSSTNPSSNNQACLLTMDMCDGIGGIREIPVIVSGGNRRCVKTAWLCRKSALLQFQKVSLNRNLVR